MISKFILNKVNKYIDISNENTLTIKTTSLSNIRTISRNINPTCIINTEKVNNIRRINKFHETVNQEMPQSGIYLSCAETLEGKKIRLKSKTTKRFRNFIQIIGFIFKRVFPKLPVIKKVFFFITNGRNRVISKAEILGRLISCGFSILECFEYENLLYIIAKKTNQPAYNLEASYGFLIKLKRHGINGVPITVYKFRTMHPYSEYLQEYIYKYNKLEKGGKFKNDFRVTKWGGVMRRVWLDELPMIYNWMKGDLQFLGVRPLSSQYISLYPQKTKNLRMKVKPGLLPPFYADMPKTFEDICKSEERYIKRYLASPVKTQWNYFLKIFYNIVVRSSRSK